MKQTTESVLIDLAIALGVIAVLGAAAYAIAMGLAAHREKDPQEPERPGQPGKPEPVKEEKVEPRNVSEYDDSIRKHARTYNFDWRIIAAQIRAESDFIPEATSSVGALGLMQIMPSTAEWLQEGSSKLLMDADFNIRLGCHYDAMLFSKTEAASLDDRYKFTFASYNAGPGRVSQRRKLVSEEERAFYAYVEEHLPAETQNYVKKIYKTYGTYKEWALP